MCKRFGPVQVRRSKYRLLLKVFTKMGWGEKKSEMDNEMACKTGLAGN